jgi:uncharacterized protein (DUF111 family)
MTTCLWIDPAMGMAGDMFAAALIGLGAPRREMLQAMKAAGDLFGWTDIHTHVDFMPGDEPALQLHINWLADDETLAYAQAEHLLAQALDQTGLRGPYAEFARRALQALIDAEHQAHSGELRHLHHHDNTTPHLHALPEGHLHEAQDILIDVMGAAWGLQALNVNLSHVTCLSPIQVGGGHVFTSHGQLPVPAPATRLILEALDAPYASGPVEFELLTPTGAAILAGLRPAFVDRQGAEIVGARTGWGLGQRKTDRPNALRLVISDQSF